MNRKLAGLFGILILGVCAWGLIVFGQTHEVVIYLENNSARENINVDVTVGEKQRLDINLSNGEFEGRDYARVPLGHASTGTIILEADNGEKYESSEILGDSYMWVQFVEDGRIDVRISQGEDFVFED
jgi:hypothetical protein